MPHPARELRSAVLDAIVARQASPGYSVAAFTAREAYVPAAAKVALEAGAVLVTVIAQQGDKSLLSRGGLYEGAQPVQVAVQAAVDPADVAACDALLDFVEELDATVRGLAGWRWLRTDPLKDENGVPYDYVLLRDAHLFESYLTAQFKLLGGDD